MTLADEFRTRNWSMYALYIGLGHHWRLLLGIYAQWWVTSIQVILRRSLKPQDPATSVLREAREDNYEEEAMHSYNTCWWICRSGILSMIVCFAIGLTNIIMLWKVIIVLFAAFCLFVPLTCSKTQKLTNLQSFIIPHTLHRGPPTPSHLPNIRQVWRICPQVLDELHPRCNVLDHEHNTVAVHHQGFDQLDRRGGVSPHHGDILCHCGIEEGSVYE